MAQNPKGKLLDRKGKIALLLCGMCVLGIVLKRGCSPRMVAESVLWAGYDGINVSKNGGKTSIVINLQTKNGVHMKMPVFSIAHNVICYWSPTDSMICIKDRNGPSIWLPVVISHGEEISGICPIPSGFVINLVDSAHKPERVLSLNLSNLSLTPIYQFIAARSVVTNTVILGMTSSGQLVTYPPQSVNFPNITIATNSMWDADFDERICCFANPNQVEILHNGHKTYWTVGMFYRIRTIIIHGAKKQIWVSVDTPFSMGSKVFAYDYEGRYLGKVLQDPLPIRSPILPMAEVDVP